MNEQTYQVFVSTQQAVPMRINEQEIAVVLFTIVRERLPEHSIYPGERFMTTDDGEVWIHSETQPSRLVIQDRDIAPLVDAANILTHGCRLQMLEEVPV